MTKEIKKTEYPENWDEDEYLRNNPDVEFAVKNNAMESGYYHYLHHGRKEGRSAAWLRAP